MAQMTQMKFEAGRQVMARQAAQGPSFIQSAPPLPKPR